jgi:hypothetical protein
LLSSDLTYSNLGCASTKIPTFHSPFIMAVISPALRTLDLALIAVEDQLANPHMPPRLIVQLTPARCALLTERNTLTASITHLPFDIIHTIIMFLSADYFARWSSPKVTKRSSDHEQHHVLMPRLPLMHTCTCMRSVFIYSLPGLWSYVDLSWQHQWLKTCIERAGLSRISLLASEYGIKTRGEADSVRTMAKRANLQWLVARHTTRSLEQEVSHLHAVVCIGEDRCCDLMAAKCPSLRDGKQEDDFWTQIRGRTPLTNLLSIDNVYISKYIGTWPSLLSLDIAYCACNEGPRSLFRKIAQATPRLEQLVLEDIWCLTTKKEDTKLESLLPFLQVLRIREDPHFVAVAAAMHAFTLPRMHLDLVVAEGTGRFHEESLGSVVMERLLHLCSLSAWSVPVTVDRGEGRQGCINVSFDVQPTAVAPWVTYNAPSLPLAKSASIFERFSTLHVRCDAVRILFTYATEDPAVLASIDHIVIIGGADGLPELSAWLVKRATAGRPIRTVSLEDTPGYRYSFGPMKVIARDLML